LQEAAAPAAYVVALWEAEAKAAARGAAAVVAAVASFRGRVEKSGR